MRRELWIMIALIVGAIFSLFIPSFALAGDTAKFSTPAKVISAAEDALAKRKFEAFANCFDAEGQKQMVQSFVGMLADALNAEAPGPAAADPSPDVKKVKTLFTKYGITDFTRQKDETDDHFDERLAAQIKDPRGFMIEVTAQTYADPKQKPPIKGELKDVKIDGAKAHATYSVKSSPSDAITQDVNFSHSEGSWKIAKAIFFVSPDDVSVKQ